MGGRRNYETKSRVKIYLQTDSLTDWSEGLMWTNINVLLSPPATKLALDEKKMKK